MITYEKSAFGLNLLFRVHGSATYRSIIPALVGALLVWLMRDKVGPDLELGEGPTTQILHPYAIGVVVSGITFLIVFRASQGYSRYWEATTSTYAMMSKWMDATVHIASYHMQSKRYDIIKPPSYNDFHHLDAFHLTRDRERIRRRSKSNKRHSSRFSIRSASGRQERAIKKSINAIDHTESGLKAPRRPLPKPLKLSGRNVSDDKSTHSLSAPTFLTGPSRLDGNWGALFSGEENTSTFYDPDEPDKVEGFASMQGGRTPALFLQELAHLSSLLVAVAFATLRNDIDGAESPLDYYEPGSPWPKVDAGKVSSLYQNQWHRTWATFLSFIGRGRTPMERTRYNALRPLPVLGGVSDAEIRFLQMARGPYAKTQLCFHWLSEFMVREHLAGSMGGIASPIISRVMQFMGDGMLHYNQGRKVMSIPFPFVHAQLSAFFVIIMVGLIPFLMDQYCEDLWSACLLTFLSLLCLSGIHEVARELENPFRNVPNELPVVTFMAEYNEALLIMFSGFHPDAFWDAPEMEEEELSGLSNTIKTVEEALTEHLAPEVSQKSDDPKLDADAQAGAMTSQCIADEESRSEKVVEKLRAVVLEQGKLMVQMMQEQTRLNQSLEEVLQHKTKLS